VSQVIPASTPKKARNPGNLRRRNWRQTEVKRFSDYGGAPSV
jgi:hypothetical protein